MKYDKIKEQRSFRYISELTDEEAVECFSYLTNTDWLKNIDKVKVRRLKRDGIGFLKLDFPLMTVHGQTTGERGQCFITDDLNIFVNLGTDKRANLRLDVGSLHEAVINLNVKAKDNGRTH